MRDKILELRKQGLSLRKIAKQVGLDKTTIDYYCNTEKFNERQNNYRRNIRKKLIDIYGGKCNICNYNKSHSALDFHHKNAEEKTFGISEGLRLKYSYEKLFNESKKCILICSNCHHEIHDKLTVL